MSNQSVSRVSAMPEPGDVIFTYSGGKEAFGSCLLQRLVFDRFTGPWISHVAVVLSSRIVIEAYTTSEEREKTWSGAILGEGVRLRLLPDLFDASSSCIALRHPTATDLGNDFGTQTPRVALLLGSGYSVKPLIDAARQASSILSYMVSGDTYDDWRADPDVIAKALRDDPELRDGIASHLRVGETLSAEKDYFCSQLAGLLLWRGGLLPTDPGTITPCGLFDLLDAADWLDVTDGAYGEGTRACWDRIPRADWELFYRADVGQARFFRESEHITAMLDHLGDKLNSFSTHLDAVRNRLDEMQAP